MSLRGSGVAINLDLEHMVHCLQCIQRGHRNPHLLLLRTPLYLKLSILCIIISLFKDLIIQYVAFADIFERERETYIPTLCLIV